MQRVLIIDNYDSFTYNIVQYVQELGASTKVYRNDEISLSQIRRLSFDRAIISPGPGRPEDSGVSCEFIHALYTKVPILGVCLGHQCIGHVFGARILKAPTIMHGKVSAIDHTGTGIFKGISNPFQATRYHSLVIDARTLPDTVAITAWTTGNVIMGVQEKTYPLYGVQFHPESILTDEGKALLNNFLMIS